MPRHDAETLKLMFPEVAFELECDQVRAELREQLGLQAYVNVDANRAIAGVTLNDGYELLITPAMPGFNGVDNWFKWRELTNPKTGETVTLSQIRCTVELLAHDPDTDSYMSLISFGIDAANMEQLVPKALGKIHKHCGLRLVALPEVNAKKSNK